MINNASMSSGLIDDFLASSRRYLPEDRPVKDGKWQQMANEK
jgi:hypothetical protein